MLVISIYDHPTDYPNHFVARRFEVGPGTVTPTNLVSIGKTYEELMAIIRKDIAGRVRFLRSQNDDPKIIETWV